jgi:hypothetical protein
MGMFWGITVTVVVLALVIAGLVWLKRLDNDYESTTEQLTDEQRRALQTGIGMTGPGGYLGGS